ncbi:MAG: hypothetical protein JJE05_04140 [Actinobacteria bacterium]|nr:hypothetical protein [Actinomycetota bacterium]
MKRMRAVWQSFRTDVDRRVRTGRMLGLLFVAGGFIAIAKGWDGASNLVRVDSQLPYLLSGGFMGVGLIATGCTLLVLASMRSERQAQSKQFEDMATLLSRTLGRMSAPAGATGPEAVQVLAGPETYHLPGCRVLEGKPDLPAITVSQAASEGLAPCRSCEPPRLAEVTEPNSN